MDFTSKIKLTLFDPRYGSKLPIMEEALNVVGKHIVINDGKVTIQSFLKILLFPSLGDIVLISLL